MQMNPASQRHWSKVSKNPFGDRYKMVDLLKESHIPLFSLKQMEQEKKKGELLSFIDKYRLLREDDLVFYIHTSMEEVQSMCQKLELSGKLRVLLRELPLTFEKRHRLITYAKSFLPLWTRILQISLNASIVVRGMLLLSHLMKRR